MTLTKNIAMIAVAAITGFSPMGVMLVQNHLERQESDPHNHQIPLLYPYTPVEDMRLYSSGMG